METCTLMCSELGGSQKGLGNIPKTFGEHRRKSERRVRAWDLLCSRSYPKESWPMVRDRTEESRERMSVLGEGALTTTGGWRVRRRTRGETYRPGDRQQRTGDDLEDRRRLLTLTDKN